MNEGRESSARNDPSLKPYLRSLGAEILVYTPLLVIYLLIVIGFIKQPLVDLFQNYPIIYSVISLVMILVQGVLLEMLTTWLLRKFGVRL